MRRVIARAGGVSALYAASGADGNKPLSDLGDYSNVSTASRNGHSSNVTNSNGYVLAPHEQAAATNVALANVYSSSSSIQRNQRQRQREASALQNQHLAERSTGSASILRVHNSAGGGAAGTGAVEVDFFGDDFGDFGVSRRQWQHGGEPEGEPLPSPPPPRPTAHPDKYAISSSRPASTSASSSSTYSVATHEQTTTTVADAELALGMLHSRPDTDQRY